MRHLLRPRYPQLAPYRRRRRAVRRTRVHRSTGPGTRSAELARLEAALFAATEPLTTQQLARQARLPVPLVRSLIKELNRLYDADRSAFHVRPIAGGWQLMTRRALAPWLARFHPPRQSLKLSAAAWETLAIIAYRQPIMRADIEAIRGVSCGEVIRQLVEKGLVRIVGHHDSLGRPALYGTTRYFLQVFGLRSIKQLPTPDAQRAANRAQGR